MLVFAIVSAESERAIELFVRREDAERLLETVRAGECDLANFLRVETVELDA